MANTPEEILAEGPYHAALLSIVAVVQQKDECTEVEVRACLEEAGLGEFYDYVAILLEEEADEADDAETDEAGSDPEDPSQENDEGAEAE